MDILNLIQVQITEIRQNNPPDYLDAILVHLERAYLYYEKGSTDSYYYNDVVYRTNQAYEGSLREAYKVLYDKTSDQVAKKSPYEIEVYLKTDSVFKGRVIQLFENYRHEWRNQSAHDYKLIIDSNEAFLALINVSAFVHLLLKLIQERIAYKQELAKDYTKNNFANISHAKGELVPSVLNLLRLFKQEYLKNTDYKEVDLLGKLNAYLEKTIDVKIQRDLLLQAATSIMRPDFIISNNIETAIIEVKRYRKNRPIDPAINQLTSYLEAADLQNGILFLLNNENYECVREVKMNDNLYKIYIV